MVKCTGFSKVNGVVNEVTVELDDKSFEGKKPPKGVIHWVAQPKPGQVRHQRRVQARKQVRRPGKDGPPDAPSCPCAHQDPAPMEVRLYTMLFKSEEPEAAENFLDDMDPDSLEILQGAYGSAPLYNAKVRPARQRPGPCLLPASRCSGHAEVR